MRIRSSTFLITVLVFTIVLSVPALASDLFTDVPSGHRFYSDVQSLASRGCLSGFADGSFRPDGLVTRQQMAKILVLAREAHSAAIDNADDPTFPDAPLSLGSPYPFDFIEECSKAGWFGGDTSGNFRPGNNITRVQLALVLVRSGGEMLSQPPAGYQTGFADTGGLVAEAQGAIATAKYNGLLDGKTATSFDPYSPATRGHVSKMVNGLVKKVAEGMVTGTSATAGEDLTEIAARVNAVLALGYNTTNADLVAKGLFDGNAANDPFLLDTREPADFAKGHIPGSVNIPLKELPRALLAKDDRIPMDKEIIVVSYWGDDGDLSVLLLNLYRVLDPAAQKAAIDSKTTPPYPKATTIFQGMVAWTFRRDVGPANTRFEDAQKAGFVLEKGVVPGASPNADQGAFPAFRSFKSDEVVDRALVRAREFFDRFPTQFDIHVYPKDLAAELEDGNSSDDPQVLSVRAQADYEKGHVPGALNIPYQKVADLANFTKFLKPGSPIVAYCYTGHTGGLATMALGILGYDVRNMLYGMNGWSTSAPGAGQLKNFDLMRGWDFPVNDGGADDLDTLADYDPPSGCQSCHSSLSGIFYDREVKNPPQGAPPAPSEGEG